VPLDVVDSVLHPPGRRCVADERHLEHQVAGLELVLPSASDGVGGPAIFRIAKDDTNTGSLVELFQNVFREPFMVQQYRPEVKDGDKRIIAGVLHAHDLQSGMDLYHALKKKSRLADIPVVMVTGHDPVLTQATQTLPPVLTKPFRAQQLLDQVADQLGKVNLLSAQG